MRKTKRKKLHSGSYTVEAALLMPTILMVTFAVIYLTFFIHNRTWFTLAAYEAALDGSMEAVRGDREMAEAKTAFKTGEAAAQSFIGTEHLAADSHVGLTDVTVTFTSEMQVPLGGFVWGFTAQGKSLIIDPVMAIRTVRLADTLW